MTKFIVLYRADEAAAAQMANSTPEDMAKGMEPWMAWAAKCGDALVDIGTPLANGTRVDNNGTASSDSGIAGYSVLEADNLDAAVKLLEGHPHLGWTEGCDIEVHEAQPMPGMA